jgi:galacturonosyltransferase
MMDKILILTNSIGGLHSFRFELIEEMIEQGYSVYFAAPDTPNNMRKDDLIRLGAKFVNTPFERRSMNLIKEFTLIKKYKALVKRIKPSLIITYTVKPNIYGGYIARKLSLPIVMTVTGLGSSLITGKFKSVIKKMYRYSCKNANAVFFENTSNLNFFLKNNIICRDKSKLVPGSGVNIEKFVPMPKSQDDNSIKFLFIGRLMKEKGIEEYLQVARDITTHSGGVEFWILGRLEDEEYKFIVEEQNQSYKYLGVVNDVRQLIRDADCIVNPSYHEGMSNVLLEGGAMGKPLLASRIPGCREIIDEGENGFLFEPKSAASLHEAIHKFIDLSFEEREKMGLASRSKIEKEFDRNIVVTKFMNTIESILRG